MDAEAQVIVAHGLDANASDQHQLTPMVDAVEAAMGRKPDQVSADAGYCSDANLEAMEERAIDAYIAPGRAKHPTDGEGGGKRVAAMREKIKAGGHETPYRLRKQLPQPVFGQIKQARGFRQFLMAGSTRSPTNGASSASPTTCSSSPRGGVCPPPSSQPPEPSRTTRIRVQTRRYPSTRCFAENYLDGLLAACRTELCDWSSNGFFALRRW